MQGTMMNFPLTLTTMLERVGTQFGSTEVVSRRADGSLHRYCYTDLYRRARALAEALQRAGLKRGDRVATLMWNHNRHLEAYFGVPVAGGVVHTLNLRLHPDELAFIANHAEDRFLIVDESLLPLFEQFRNKVKIERVFVVSENDAGAHYDRLRENDNEDYEEFLKTATGDFEYPALQSDSAAAMCYTSGTTGKPKGVMYSHGALVLHSFAFSLPDAISASMHDVFMACAPMFHANSHGIPYVAALVGAKLVLPGPHPTSESLLDLFASEQVSALTAVPTVWLGLVEALEKHPGRWKIKPRLRSAIGGTAVPESLLRRADALGIKLVHIWGMTETTPMATICNPKPHLQGLPEDERYELRCKQGFPLPFVEVRAEKVRAENEQGIVPWDGSTIGELQVRGPWVAGSYFNMPDTQQRWTQDGWFRTGDVVCIDADGYIKIADRSKDLIKSGGEWISSVDLESELKCHPAVREAAVIAVPHPKWDERPLAVLVLNAGMSVTEEQLSEHLAAKFAKWQLPDGFVFVSQIPHTSTGKTLKSDLRRRYKDWHTARAESGD